ncbi:MAG: glutaredoxin family protein [Dehalococcoidia bacterium]
MKVTLYTKEDCGLCHKAEQIVRRLQRKNRFELELVDIEADSAAHARYWDRIPVIAVDGKEVASAPLDERRLSAILSA